MPIVRRDEAPDTFAPRVLYLWSKKWLIILATVGAFVLTYLALLAVPEEFEASAEIYVNRLAVFQDNQLNPLTVATIVKSDEVLLKVRDAVAEKYKLNPKPPLEKFVKQFRVKTEVLQDTTVRKDVSPVVLLTVSGRGREVTHFLMQTWLGVIVRDYANVGVTEATTQLEALKKQDRQLEAELAEAEALQAQYASVLPLHEQMLAEHIDFIAPSRLDRPEPPRQAIGHPVEDAGSQVNMQVQVTNPPAKDPGLISRLAEMQLAAARSGGDDAATSPGAAQDRNEARIISGFIDDRITSITTLQGVVASLRQKLNSVSREIDVKTAQQRELHRFLDQIAVIAAMHIESQKVGGDLRVLTQPVLPDLRVWPKRTLVALVVAIAVFIMSIAAVLMHQYLREAAMRTSSTA